MKMSMPEFRESQFKEALVRAGTMVAFGEGKPIQSKSKESSNWQDDFFPSWNWEEYDYKVKEQEKWRAFERPEEFPTGIVKIRGKDSTYWSLVLAVGDFKLTGVRHGELVTATYLECFETGDEISLDGGKTWQPCGVKES